MRPKKVVVLAIVAAALFTAVRASAQSLTSELIWTSSERTQALFVPASVLEQGVGRAPLSTEHRAALQQRIESVAGTDRCSRFVLGHTREVAPERRRTIAQVTSEARTLFTGRVVAAVPGWSSWTLEPVVMVWLEPESILRDADAVIGDAPLLAFQVSDAELKLDGARLCSKTPGMIVPRAGDRVLVDARERFGDGRMLVVQHFFPIYNGDIRHQPFEDMVPFAPFALERVKKDAAEVRR